MTWMFLQTEVEPRVPEALVPYLAVEVAADGFLGPGLVVKRRPALLLRVPHHVCHQLQEEEHRKRLVFTPSK